jgi:OmpA-OmpF porin, OOP family
MFRQRALTAAFVLAVPLVAHGQLTYEPSKYFDERWYVTPFGSYIFSDSDRRAGDDWGGGLAIGKALHPNWNVELRAMYEELSAESGGPGKYKNWSGTLDAHYFFFPRAGLHNWQSRTVHPYLIAGIGAINDKVSGSSTIPSGDKTSFMANVGVGFVWPFSSWGRLVGDVRYRWSENKGNVGSGSGFDDWIASVGLQIPLGPPPRVAEPPRPAPPPPPPAPKPEPKPEAKPEAKPAPPPPPPKKPVVERVELSGEGTFAFGKAALTDAGRGRIEKVVQDLRSAGVTVTSMVITGYTDPIGKPDSNQRLSLERANAVRDHMVKLGVPAGIIRTEGRGEADLKVTEADCKAKGQAKTRKALIECLLPNRRVEVHATGEKQS